MDKDNTLYWLWLTHISGIGAITIEQLMTRFRSAGDIFEANESELMDAPGMTKHRAGLITSSRTKEHLQEAKDLFGKCTGLGIEVITREDVRYPERMKNLHDLPSVLYSRGEWRIDQMQKTIGIIGARRCTREARQRCIEETKRYTQEGFTIISGMAKGIDSYAHVTCMNEGGYTVAILGNGLDQYYPEEEKLLQDQIAKDGLLISQFDPGKRPSQYTFPLRNRLVAAMSDKLLVIGAGRNSGTEITVAAAVEFQNRQIITA